MKQSWGDQPALWGGEMGRAHHTPCPWKGGLRCCSRGQKHTLEVDTEFTSPSLRLEVVVEIAYSWARDTNPELKAR